MEIEVKVHKAGRSFTAHVQVCITFHYLFTYRFFNVYLMVYYFEFYFMSLCVICIIRKMFNILNIENSLQS